jgi:hypothetical protein
MSSHMLGQIELVGCLIPFHSFILIILSDSRDGLSDELPLPEWRASSPDSDALPAPAAIDE